MVKTNKSQIKKISNMKSVLSNVSTKAIAATALIIIGLFAQAQQQLAWEKKCRYNRPSLQTSLSNYSLLTSRFLQCLAFDISNAFKFQKSPRFELPCRPNCDITIRIQKFPRFDLLCRSNCDTNLELPRFYLLYRRDYAAAPFLTAASIEQNEIQAFGNDEITAQ